MDLQHVLLEAVGSVGDPLAIRGEERATIVAGLIRELADVAAVGIHHVDVGIAVTVAHEQDCAAVG